MDPASAEDVAVSSIWALKLSRMLLRVNVAAVGEAPAGPGLSSPLEPLASARPRFGDDVTGGCDVGGAGVGCVTAFLAGDDDIAWRCPTSHRKNNST